MLCNSKQSKRFLAVNDRLLRDREGYLIRCDSCGLVYSEKDGIPLRSFYVDEYYWHLEEKRSFIGKRLKDIEEWFIKLFLYPEVNIFCSQVLKKDSKILEVGCGTGLFLKMLKDRGFTNLTGIEMDARSAMYGSERYEISITNRDFESLAFEDNYFDIIILNHMLEHVEDPVLFLCDVKKIMNMDGVIMVSVPNIMSWQARVFKERWFGIEYPRHRCHFSEKTLKKMLQLTGFQINNACFISMRTNAVCLVLSMFPIFDLSRIKQKFKSTLLTQFLKGTYLLLLLLTVPLGLLENRLRKGTTITVFARKVC